VKAARYQGAVAIENLEHNVNELAQRFAEASPFPHIVLDDVLRADFDDVGFPDMDWDGWYRSPERYQFNKVTCKDPERIPDPYMALIDEMSRPRFLRFLEQLSGIDGLIPDPYLEGGGIHMSGPGGILASHTDFHVHPHFKAYRRLNIILYLAHDWSERDGGCLQLSDKDGVVKQLVVPAFGRAVIFETSDHSYHGFPVPVVDGKFRRSIALYYYTVTDAAGFGGLLTTDWRGHGKGNAVFRARVHLYQALLNVARAFTMAAHLANPNQGRGALKDAWARRGSR
jgi:hypothetical protein